MKKKKTKTKVAKGVLLISFIILLMRLIYSSINAWNHYHNNHMDIFNSYNIIQIYTDF